MIFDSDCAYSVCQFAVLSYYLGNVIRYFVLRALQLPPEAWLRLAVYNASITVLTVSATGRVSLRMLGDVGHLPPEMITYN